MFSQIRQVLSEIYTYIMWWSPSVDCAMSYISGGSYIHVFDLVRTTGQSAVKNLLFSNGIHMWGDH